MRGHHKGKISAAAWKRTETCMLYIIDIQRLLEIKTYAGKIIAVLCQICKKILDTSEIFGF